MSLLSNPIIVSDTEGVKFAKLQRLFRAIADAASISYTMAYPLNDIDVGDTEGVKWAKLGAWSKLISDNISGGGGGTGNVRSATVALAQNDASKAVIFSTAFTGAGVPSLVPTVIPPVGGDAIDAYVEDSDITNAGATITFSAPIPTAGYYLAYVANKE